MLGDDALCLPEQPLALWHQGAHIPPPCALGLLMLNLNSRGELLTETAKEGDLRNNMKIHRSQVSVKLM